MRLSCIDVEEAIWDRARGGGELSQDALLHIERCESCAAALAGAEMSLNALRCVRAYPAAPDCVAQVAERISGQRRVFRPLGWVAIPAAIAILLLVFLVPNKTPPVRQVKAPTPAKSKALVPKPVQPRQARPHKRPWYADYGRLIAKVMPKEPERLAMAVPENASFEMPPLPRRSYSGGVVSALAPPNPFFISDAIIGHSGAYRVATTTVDLYGCYNYFRAPATPFLAYSSDGYADYKLVYANRLDLYSDFSALTPTTFSYTRATTSPTIVAANPPIEDSALVGAFSVGFKDGCGGSFVKKTEAPAKLKVETVNKRVWSGIRMVAVPAKSTVYVGEPIALHITVTNETKSVIRLSDSYPEADYTLTIKGPGGEVCPRPERWPPGVWRNIVRRMEPGETISCDYQVDKMYDLSRPGRYCITLRRFILNGAAREITTGPVYLLVQPKP